jgi:hypothetical protein
VVVNRTSSEIRVSINGAHVSTVPVSDTRVSHEGTVTSPGRVEIIQGIWGLPPLPWEVLITRVSDGVELASRHFTIDDGDEAELVVSDSPPALAFGPCGSFG